VTGQFQVFLAILMLTRTELDDHAGVMGGDVTATDIADILIMIEIGANSCVIHLCLLK
jgi:hypothetical protein